MPVKSSSSDETDCYESMDKLLVTKDGLAAFSAFLKSEFSDENLEFWLACEDLKNTKTNPEIVSKVNKIYCEFIHTEAPRQINIDHKTRDMISDTISKPTSTSFDYAQKQIACLMAKDSYPRFLRSDNYKELMKKQEKNGQKRWLSF
ncbi:regulator of G-protein signaling 21-like [Ascaphus truei]|uniref:regulator of G-protein signaling 21-like n=1 Tax=Ascaphus truei TaxID=8439 RepID=UPI003F5A8691